MSQYNVQRIKSTQRCNSIDMREVLKNELLKQGSVDKEYQITQSTSTGPTTTAAPIAQNIGFEDVELYFDSVNSDSSSDLLNGELKWPITVLNNTQDVKNCIQVHLSSFFFPKIYIDAIHPEFFYYRRVYLEIMSAPSSQSVLASNNNRFHFEFSVNNINGQAVELKPLKETFFFQRPLTSLTDFNVRFMIPSNTLPNSFKKIPLPPYRVQLLSVLNGGVGYNPIRFQIVSGETTKILGLVGSLGTPGLAVFVSEYNSNDALINQSVNDQQGVYVTNIINDTTFEIGGIDATTITGEYNASMYIPKNRIAFPVRFTTVRNFPTNYVTVEHH